MALTRNIFKEQFNLQTAGDTPDFYDNKVSYINSPTTYMNAPITSQSMYPNNYFDKLKNSPYILNHGNLSTRRDNTLVINDWASDITGQYARPKNENGPFFKLIKNDSAVANCNTQIVDRIDTTRFSDALNLKNGDLLEDTRVVPQFIDGAPLTNATFRPGEKTLEELRGNGVNNKIANPYNRINKTGHVGEGQSSEPKSSETTHFKMKSYKDQTTDDLLKTTGAYLKPEWRSKIKESIKEEFLAVNGPSKADVNKSEYHNNNMANTTIREDTAPNNKVGPAINLKSILYKNNQSANNTIREVTGSYNKTGPAVNTTTGSVYENHQPSTSTIREETGSNNKVGPAVNTSSGSVYENHQLANNTIRETTSVNTIMGPTTHLTQGTSYENHQPANSTIRETTSINTIMGPTTRFTQGNVYENHNPINPTIRETTSINTIMGPTTRFTQGNVYENHNPLTPTIRETTNINTIMGPTTRFTQGTAYENHNPTNPTIRETTSINTIMGPTTHFTQGNVYENHNPTNPTIRESTSINTLMGPTTRFTQGNVYENHNPTNPTIRETTSVNTLMGPTTHFTQGTTYENHQSSNPTIRETTSINTTMGPTTHFTQGTTYENHQASNATIRETTAANNKVGHASNFNQSLVYENHNPTNPTIRETTGTNNKVGPAVNTSTSTIYKNNDNTRSGLVEESLARDYNGAKMSVVSYPESYEQFNNFNSNEKIEAAMDLTNRPLAGGGKDQLPASINELGVYNNNMKRETFENYEGPRVRNVLQNCVVEIPQTRGYNLLEERSNITSNIANSLVGNPYINNLVYLSKATVDPIMTTTNISSRTNNY